METLLEILERVSAVAYHNGKYSPEDANDEDFFGDADWTFKINDLTFYYDHGFDGTNITRVFLKDMLVYSAGNDGGHSIETFVYHRGDTLSEYLKEENWEKKLQELYVQTLKRIDEGTCNCEACSKFKELCSD